MFNWIAGVIQHGGVLGVFLLMTLENVFPPLPSELIMPMAGYVAARGAVSPVAVVLAGTAGSAIGAVLWYFIGRWLGLERLRRWTAAHGRWIGMSCEDLDRAAGWFRRWGVAAVLVGRTLPGVRGVICIPAGVAEIGFWPFFIASTVGSLLWSALLTGAGLMLAAKYTLVERWLNPVTWGFLLVCLGAYGARVALFRRHRR